MIGFMTPGGAYPSLLLFPASQHQLEDSDLVKLPSFTLR
jgi:hypothetical protein